MQLDRSRISHNVLLIAAGTIALALVMLLALTGWQFAKDVHSLAQELLLEQIRTVRSEAVHVVGRIEQVLESKSVSLLEPLGELEEATKLRSPIADHPDRYPYSAIVNSQGVIVWHTDRQEEGRQLGREWYESVAYDLGTDVVKTKSSTLTGGVAAYDIHVPIFVAGTDVGSYHVGLSESWFNQWSKQTRRAYLFRGLVWLGLVTLVVAAAAASLAYLTCRISLLRTTVTETYMRAASELGRLSAGLAHEIRNPLHALRLNLHAFRRTQQDPSALEPQEIGRMLDESSHEIDRIDKLLQQLINFATPAQSRKEAFNLNAELEGVVDFIGQELRRSNVNVHLAVPKCPVSIRMDPARLRQIMLNLLHNARDAMPKGGCIDVQLTRQDSHVEIAVADEGSGIADADLPHIFEPFFTTSDAGTGLGLALVKRFVREAGGDITCETNDPHGTRFCVRLTAAAGVKYHGGGGK